jgi:hypothetical protein
MRDICPDRHPDLSEEQRQLVRNIWFAQYPYKDVWSDAYRLLIHWNTQFDQHDPASDFEVMLQCRRITMIVIRQQAWELPWCKPMPFGRTFNIRPANVVAEFERLKAFLAQVLLVKDLCPHWFPIKITKRNCPAIQKQRKL